MKGTSQIVQFIKDLYPEENVIPLHRPLFLGNERKYCDEAIQSGLISNYGSFLEKLENLVIHRIGIKHVIPTVNGTASLQVSLLACGVKPGEEVITQGLGFAAVANSIVNVGAFPIFLDIEPECYGLSPDKLDKFLRRNAIVQNGQCINKLTNNVIGACIPIHTLGLPGQVIRLSEICKEWMIPLIEDAAEAVGSTYKGDYCGCMGDLGIYSFNGNKTVTSGGGGMILTNKDSLAKRIRLLINQSKIPHPFKYVHDGVGFNYRMPNLNAAIACAQFEQLDEILSMKRRLHNAYREELSSTDFEILGTSDESNPNYWINGILFRDRTQKDTFIMACLEEQIECREAWMLFHENKTFDKFYNDGLQLTKDLHDRLALVPSGIPKSYLESNKAK